ATSLLSKEQRQAFLTNIEKEYIQLKQDFENKRTVKTLLPFTAAQQNTAKINWSNYAPVKPSFNGNKQFLNFDLQELRKYIDWQPFFIAWELHGKFPAILTDTVVGEEAKKLFEDANQLLDQIISEKWLTAQGTIGFRPAVSNGKDT
ncbi:MAG: vitamin B12 dependent-methionine synthase activation domain-containing protein, partial [bacterium]